MMGAALLAAPSCTDSWNDHYADSDAFTSNETLWQLIESRDDLSRFRSIVEKAQFYRDENHAASTTVEGVTTPYTYKDLLNGNATYTLWVPENDALTEDEWKQYEQMAEDPKQGYNLQQQFIGNQMALYRKSMTGNGSEDVRLVNNKIATLDYDNNTFSGIEMATDGKGDKEMNIGAKNGIMHIIKKQNPFEYNVYEYIKFSDDAPSIIKDYLVSRDTTYFMSSGSIEGLPDEDGNPTYVDSVYFNGNMNFNQSSWCADGAGLDASQEWMNNLKMLHAEINAEDSTFVMIVPTNTAWTTAYDNLTPLYTYTNKYPRMDKVKETGSTTKHIGIDKEAYRIYPNGKGYMTLDSLQDVNLMMDIMQPLCFNVNLQRTKDGNKITAEELVNGGYRNCKFLVNTAGDTIREDESWKWDELFDGKKIKMSNGYVIQSDKWDMPRDQWMRDIEVECTYNDYDKSNSTLYSVNTLSNETAKSWIWDYGTLGDENYMHVYGKTETTNPYIVIPLYGSKEGDAQVLSGKYDIQLVMVPRWYEESLDTAAIDTSKILKNYLKCTLYYWDSTCPSKSNYQYTKQVSLASDNFVYDGERVETITVFEDVKFPVSYKNMKNAYPVLKIEGVKWAKAAGYDQSLHSYMFNIDRIYLKSKESEMK